LFFIYEYELLKYYFEVQLGLNQPIIPHLPPPNHSHLHPLSHLPHLIIPLLPGHFGHVGKSPFSFAAWSWIFTIVSASVELMINFTPLANFSAVTVIFSTFRCGTLDIISAMVCNLARAHESEVVSVVSTPLAVLIVAFVNRLSNLAISSACPEPDLSNHPFHLGPLIIHNFHPPNHNPPHIGNNPFSFVAISWIFFIDAASVQFIVSLTQLSSFAEVRLIFA
jgi:hypothetical protein